MRWRNIKFLIPPNFDKKQIPVTYHQQVYHHQITETEVYKVLGIFRYSVSIIHFGIIA